ncbi:GCN5-related protein N-acetyltransferase [Beutenbergia cavernae DSM 12333]|uniref:GCN5-related protein N-acetyltransferase n=1 Tax=Beutenbergia cavernae (strain ATCC BAA-8 / DSM 12333 / CCUG 43141 / JCM 11478 / NBRC 16432 / NCIMB 13614 / HKI 0122) TaxID=471853 RepID=C5C0Z5_BEUC1|nr:GNAT family N-acetyltransferase [Beutenbergia cavernae]ACQ79399.1 GCN5-related protein N-acetyltransferase [Beutenbergia cavernae DSM 12333]
MTGLTLRPARPDEAALLGDLALHSKAHWGYDDDFLAIVAGELTYDPASIEARRTVVAERDGDVVGFVTLDGAPPVGEIGNLFVEPAAIGTGVGRALWDHAVDAAAALGFDTLVIESDPFAAGFYASRGAQPDGETPSGSIPGRVLPRFRYDLTGR